MWRTSPSKILGEERGSYRAWCIDQAVQYFGTYVEGELDKIGHKKSSKERRVEADRKRKLEQLLEPPSDKPKKGQYMDPAFFFQQT